MEIKYNYFYFEGREKIKQFDYLGLESTGASLYTQKYTKQKNNILSLLDLLLSLI